MKIRDGFVSNSSSSSFVIYGAWVDADEVKKFLSKEQLADVEKNGLEEVMYDVDLPMHFHYDYYEERCAFGKSWSGIKDDETGKQFKESIKKKLSETFNRDIECATIEHTYSC